MKNRWSISLGVAMLVGLVGSTALQGMKRLRENVVQSNSLSLQVWFAPQDQDQIMNELSALLENAKKQVIIAMYWITDQLLIEKIIAAKKRGVDVQIVIDESMSLFSDLNSLIDKFVQNNIIPIIYPSKHGNAAGKMHNKFIVVDTTTVFTGSANFTRTALDSSSFGFNFENVVVINSTDIAKRFVVNFDEMDQMIFDFYVEIIASSNLNQLPVWMHRLFPLVYQNQLFMRQSVQKTIERFNAEEQRKIKSFFGIQSTTAWEHATVKQQDLLRSKGVPIEEIAGLSKQEASSLISKIIKQGSLFGTRPATKWDPAATEAQQRLLRNMGVPDEEISGLSKREASDLIDEIKQEQEGVLQYHW